MTETLEQIKKTIAEAHEQGIYNWNTATISSLVTTIDSQQVELDKRQQEINDWHAEVDKLADERHELINEVDNFKDLLFDSKQENEQLKKLIESQKEEIARHQEREFNHYPMEILELETRIFKLQDDAESQKDITELAVKALESISTGYYGAVDCKAFSIGILREIKALK